MLVLSKLSLLWSVNGRFRYSTVSLHFTWPLSSFSLTFNACLGFFHYEIDFVFRRFWPWVCLEARHLCSIWCCLTCIVLCWNLWYSAQSIFAWTLGRGLLIDALRLLMMAGAPFIVAILACLWGILPLASTLVVCELYWLDEEKLWWNAVLLFQYHASLPPGVIDIWLLG